MVDSFELAVGCLTCAADSGRGNVHSMPVVVVRSDIVGADPWTYGADICVSVCDCNIETAGWVGSVDCAIPSVEFTVVMLVAEGVDAASVSYVRDIVIDDVSVAVACYDALAAPVVLRRYYDSVW